MVFASDLPSMKTTPGFVLLAKDGAWLMCSSFVRFYFIPVLWSLGGVQQNTASRHPPAGPCHWPWWHWCSHPQSGWNEAQTGTSGLSVLNLPFTISMIMEIFKMQTRKMRGPRTEPSPIPMDSGLKDVATILIKTTGDFKSYWICCTTLETGNGSLSLDLDSALQCSSFQSCSCPWCCRPPLLHPATSVLVSGWTCLPGWMTPTCWWSSALSRPWMSPSFASMSATWCWEVRQWQGAPSVVSWGPYSGHSSWHLGRWLATMNSCQYNLLALE